MQFHAAEIDAMVSRVASLVTTMAAIQSLHGSEPDISLAEMRQLLERIDISLAGEEAGQESDFAYLASPKGTIIAHSDENLMIGEGNPGVNISRLPSGDTLAAAPSGYATHNDKDGSERFVYWASAPLN